MGSKVNADHRKRRGGTAPNRALSAIKDFFRNIFYRKATLNDLETGNLLWGHSRGIYQVDRDKFGERFVKLLAKAGYDNYGVKLNHKKQCKCFVVRPYWWGDDDAPEVSLPNFECEELGFTMTWYKYALRDSYSNKPLTEKLMSEIEDVLERELKK